MPVSLYLLFYRMPPRRLRRNLPAPEVEEEPRPAKRGRRAKNRAPSIATSHSTEQEVTPLQEIMAQLPTLISNAVKEGIEAASAVGLAEAIQPDRSDSVALPSNTANNATPSTNISGAINSVVEEITGERSLVDRPTSKFTSVSVPLASRVSERIKAKIWADEYIDFARLLSAETESQQYSFKVNGSSGSSPVLSLEPTNKIRPITRFEQWQSAFEVFVAVFTERLPQSAPSLMKYGAVIRELASHSANWKFYDENFRQLRQKRPIPWDEINSELWLRAQYPAKNNYPNASNPFRSPGNTSQNSNFRSFPKGYCWRFHSGAVCSSPNCAFKHQCFKCQTGSHPASRCFRQSSKDTTKDASKPSNTATNTNASNASKKP